MAQYKKPVFTEQELGRNPNAGTLVIPIRQVSMPGQYVKQEEEGSTLTVPNIVSLEATPITKVYASPQRRERISALPAQASKLWLWIQQELEPGKDYVWVNRMRYMNETKIKSVNTYKEAVRLLLRTEFLALTLVTDVFWINADYIFMGDRIKKYPDSVKITGKAEK